jgi:branched-subunit amino acid ABC-type transport system permease component
MLVEQRAYRPLRLKGAPRLNLLITSIGVSLLVENSIVVFVSADFHPFPRVLPSTSLVVGGVRIPPLTSYWWGWACSDVRPVLLREPHLDGAVH